MTQIPPPGGPAYAAAPPRDTPTSGAAVASLVFGILAFCTLGLTAILGIILGIIGLIRTGRRGGMRGRGMAIAGTLLSVLVLFLDLVVVSFMLLVAQAHDRARIETSVSFGDRYGHVAARQVTPREAAAQSMINLTCLADAAQKYAEENDGRLPPPGGFPSALLGYLEPDGRPDAPPGRAYGMNGALCGLRASDLRDADRTVLFFECLPQGPFVGGSELLRPLTGDEDAYVIAFADGHVEWVSRDAAADLIWVPKVAGESFRL
jgi:hypothetical protein